MSALIFSFLCVGTLGFVTQFKLSNVRIDRILRKGDVCITKDHRARVVLATTDVTTKETELNLGAKADDLLSMPLSYDEMLSMASQAVADAYEKGKTRQVIRLLLPRDPKSGQLGQYFEDEAMTSNRIESSNMLLVPPDETWQGGIMQLYRAAVPTCTEILRRISSNKGGIPPTITEDRSVDESGVDGVGVLLAQSKVSPEEDASCFVQPSQETIDVVENISAQAGKRLVVLMNPQWRNSDDAFDKASKEGGFLGGLASFLGGKGGAIKRLEEMNFESSFTIEGYVCRGRNVRMVKRFDSNWIVFSEEESTSSFLNVGSSKTRPTYQEIDSMLEENGIMTNYLGSLGRN